MALEQAAAVQDAEGWGWQKEVLVKEVGWSVSPLPPGDVMPLGWVGV